MLNGENSAKIKSSHVVFGLQFLKEDSSTVNG